MTDPRSSRVPETVRTSEAPERKPSLAGAGPGRHAFFIVSIAALLCIASVAVYELTPGGELAQPTPLQRSATEQADAPAPPPPTALSATTALPAADSAVRIPAPAAAPAPASAYPSEPARLLRALEPLLRDVDHGLATLDAHSRCPLGALALGLSLETGDGEVTIKEVGVRPRPAEAEGATPESASANDQADAATVACVRGELLGRSFRAPSALPGRRWEMSWLPTHRQQ
jgi:hypothetical protein